MSWQETHRFLRKPVYFCLISQVLYIYCILDYMCFLCSGRPEGARPIQSQCLQVSNQLIKYLSVKKIVFHGGGDVVGKVTQWLITCVNSPSWAPWLGRKWSLKAYLRWFMYRFARTLACSNTAQSVMDLNSRKPSTYTRLTRMLTCIF